MQALRHASREVPTIVELSQGKQTGIGADFALMPLDNDRNVWEKFKRNRLSSLRDHPWPPLVCGKCL
jgi:hypothetical protein